eukprot:1708922-Amphidinium_carterae.1
MEREREGLSRSRLATCTRIPNAMHCDCNVLAMHCECNVLEIEKEVVGTHGDIMRRSEVPISRSDVADQKL